jgi:hypothetical protein
MLDKIGDKVLETLRFVAPTLATAIGGPFAGAAVHTIARGLLGKDDATEEEVLNAIRMASPDDLVKLKEIEKDFALKMKEAGVRLEEIDAADRDSARRRQIAMRDRTPIVLAIMAFLGLVGVAAVLAFVEIPDENSDLLKVLATALTGVNLQAANYFFGSSRGSKEKNYTIERLKTGGD